MGRTILVLSHLSGVLVVHRPSERMDSPVNFRRVKLRQVLLVALPAQVAQAGGSEAVVSEAVDLVAAEAADSAVAAEAGQEARGQTGPAETMLLSATVPIADGDASRVSTGKLRLA